MNVTPPYKIFLKKYFDKGNNVYNNAKIKIFVLKYALRNALSDVPLVIGQSIITTRFNSEDFKKKINAYVRGRFIVGDEKLEATAEFDTSTEDAWSLDLPKGLVCVDLTFSTQMQRRYAAPAENGLDSRSQLF